MVIGCICSHDLFKTSCEGLKHDILPIAGESRMFSHVLNCLGGIVIITLNFVLHTNVHARCRRSWRAFLEQF